jgi:hypothetical protein
MSRDLSVAAYYFPNYHVDARNELVHGRGWTEWELVKAARPRFPGHRQPRLPLWGCTDEADPREMARKIDAAADGGLDAFIFDWYWYDDGPYLQRGLDEGFLGAQNNRRLKFALMWANHNWVDIHPARLGAAPKLLYPGPVSAGTFDRITDKVVADYFTHPAYWHVGGCPYFSIYELFTLVKGLGGVGKTRAALSRFREKARAAGLPGVHLNAVVWGIQILPGEQAVGNPDQLVRQLGFDSVGSYVWVHHVPMKDFPTNDYVGIAARAQAHWQRAAREFSLPFHPNVTMGWDSSPRTCQTDEFKNAGYPFCPTLANNTPENFAGALRAAREFLAPRPAGQRVLTINAWNEWTEGSYLEPDTVTGLGYLEAIRTVMGRCCQASEEEADGHSLFKT